MLIDGDTVRLDGPNVRLTREGNAPYDTLETWRPQNRSEAKLGDQKTGAARAMTGTLCVIGGPGSGGYGRMPGVLYGADGRDVGRAHFDRGLVKTSMNADWCA
ncbi:hypothetical protein RM543_04830 [Roseicyclus sp. F158]|uniref:Dihydroxy-acid dehydratase n=1 Tax=Tropicimonas omnivorans TaxID=3075590 RepID=A0ABU3DE58_9RHOB|nr:hypothetical protein [Roseicyclus sp. F158]MDT0682001.1 hypothetical protein [Roseicyclus sp. F158]